ncbi:MAG: ABC transporter permease [Ruminococcus sp.]|nr:ABC transporter permease [Ruminococcus sp.]
MYIFKNALRCISRAKGRNILLGIIALIVAISCCVGLSIRQAAESTRKETAESLTVTATISFDRQAKMEQLDAGRGQDRGEGFNGGFDKEQFKGVMGESSSLTIEEYKTYALAQSVQEFYYTLSASLNGSENLLPVSNSTSSNVTDTEDAESDESVSEFSDFGGFSGGMPDMGGGMNRLFGAQSDFSVVGYSSDSSMVDFTSGVATIEEGVMFDEGTEELNCVISKELATYNDITVGDVITFTNPNSEDEIYELTVVGIYSNSEANSSSFSMMGSTSSDPANAVYMSAAALSKITELSEEAAVIQTDDRTGMEFSSAVTSTVNATYVLGDVDAYYAFEEEVRELGLSEDYTVSSTDLNQYESSLLPLETLSTMAGWFLLVVLLIGAVVLVVLNIFNIRERKYEIGVLTAMGMKKFKVALQFLTEIFVITIVAVIIGAVVGGVVSVPVSNALLQNQIEAQSNQSNRLEESFGRPQMGGMNKPEGMEAPDNMPAGDFGGGFKGGFNQIFGEEGFATEYVTEINSAMNITVVFQLLGIAVLLTLIAGAASMLFIMSYDPLKILANRD